MFFTKDELATGKVNHNFNLEAFPGTDAPGISVFYKDKDGNIFHTYSAYGRGTETTMNTYNYLDYVPKGRDEDGLRFTMSWLRHHDRYESGQLADAACPTGQRTLCAKTTERGSSESRANSRRQLNRGQVQRCS